MKAITKFIEELKTKAVDWQTEDDGSGHKGETTYTFYLADIEQLLTKHEEAVVDYIFDKMQKEYQEIKKNYVMISKKDKNKKIIKTMSLLGIMGNDLVILMCT